MRGRLLRTLLGAGFSARLSKAMLEKLPTGQSYAQGMAFARSELMRARAGASRTRMRCSPQGGVYALMGPTGVGKTTTTAKLAARCVMRFGADKLALVTTDSYRIGAYEQLRIYGQILNVPVYAVKDAADLHLVLQDLRDKHMVLIDTVGMSQRDRAVSEQIAMLCSSHRPVKRLLLLNATSHGDTLNEVVHAYRHGGAGNELAGCIFTKVDEATHPGALIDTVIRHRLPVHYISSGQKVPENLMPAERAQLVDSVFQPRRHNALFVPARESTCRTSPSTRTPSAQVVQAQAESRPPARAVPEPDPRHGARRAGTGDRRRRARRRADRLREVRAHSGATPADEDIGHKAVLQDLMVACAAARSRPAATRHVLALSRPGRPALERRRRRLRMPEQPAAVRPQRPAAGRAEPVAFDRRDARRRRKRARKPGMRQVQWLRQQDFGKSLVHVLPRLPGASSSWRDGRRKARSGWRARRARPA